MDSLETPLHTELYITQLTAAPNMMSKKEKSSPEKAPVWGGSSLFGLPVPATNFTVSVSVVILGGLALGCLFLYIYSFSESDPLNLLSSITPNFPQAKTVSPVTVLKETAMEENKTGEMDSLDRVLKEAAMWSEKKSKTVIITVINRAWAEAGSIFDLFLESFRMGKGTKPLLNNLVAVALDNNAYVRCLEVHTHCFNLTTRGTDFSTEAFFMSPTYLQMMWRRIDFLRLVLSKGYDFIFTDTDIMWLRNPFPRFLPDGDFQIASDFTNGNPYDLNNFPNGGFTYVKSNNSTIRFYKFWYDSRTHYPGLHDQDVLNKIKYNPYLADIGLQMRLLDTAFFGGFCQPAKDLNLACTMHANCCVGLDRKIHDLTALLHDWRNFLSGKNVSSWSVPHDCL